MKKVFLILVVSLVLFSCADTSPHVVDCVTSDSYGFWAGIWHGIIAPFSFVGSLIWDDVAVYAYDNNGGWYNFGFLLGVGGITFGSSNNKKR